MTELVNIIVPALVAIAFGLVLFVVHKATTDSFEYDSDFGLVFLIVPTVVALLVAARMTIVNAISIAGVLAIIRYRSVQIKARDIAFIFMSVGVGFCAGMKLYIPGAAFLALSAIVIVAYTLILSFRAGKNVRKTLKICVPESINCSGLFDDVIAKYTSGHKLMSTSVISGGTVIELVYTVKIKNEAETKAFIDELRVMNANFKITVCDIR